MMPSDLSRTSSLVAASKLDELAPALVGYPVGDLLSVAETVEGAEKGRALALVVSCIKNWIAALDVTLGAYMSSPSASLEAVREKLLRARDALAQLLASVLSPGDVVPTGRAQLC